MATDVLNTEPGTVTVWSDIGCPWATLALHTLHARAADRSVTLRIDHRAFPLELFNSMPTPKYIVDAEVVVIAARRPEVGWRTWSAPEWTYPVTTMLAMEAVQAAKAPEVGGLTASDELDAALRHAFYVDHRCIGIHSVILDLAEQCPHVDVPALAAALARGAGRTEIYDQWEVAKGRPPVSRAARTCSQWTAWTPTIPARPTTGPAARTAAGSRCWSTTTRSGPTTCSTPWARDTRAGAEDTAGRLLAAATEPAPPAPAGAAAPAPPAPPRRGPPAGCRRPG